MKQKAEAGQLQNEEDNGDEQEEEKTSASSFTKHRIAHRFLSVLPSMDVLYV